MGLREYWTRSNNTYLWKLGMKAALKLNTYCAPFFVVLVLSCVFYQFHKQDGCCGFLFAFEGKKNPLLLCLFTRIIIIYVYVFFTDFSTSFGFRHVWCPVADAETRIVHSCVEDAYDDKNYTIFFRDHRDKLICTGLIFRKWKDFIFYPTSFRSFIFYFYNPILKKNMDFFLELLVYKCVSIRPCSDLNRISSIYHFIRLIYLFEASVAQVIDSIF